MPCVQAPRQRALLVLSVMGLAMPVIQTVVTKLPLADAWLEPFIQETTSSSAM